MASGDLFPSVHYKIVKDASKTSGRSELTNIKINISSSSKGNKSYPSFNFNPTNACAIVEVEKCEEIKEICRICHEEDSRENFVYPCNCRGTIGAVHVTCIELYLNMRNNSSKMCEICRAEIPVEKRRGSFREYISEDRARLSRIIIISVINLIMFTLVILMALGENEIHLYLSDGKIPFSKVEDNMLLPFINFTTILQCQNNSCTSVDDEVIKKSQEKIMENNHIKSNIRSVIVISIIFIFVGVTLLAFHKLILCIESFLKWSQSPDVYRLRLKKK